MTTFGPYDGLVEKVQDGDTVYVALDVGFDLTVHAKIRVIGINAPELATEEGRVSRDFAKSVLPIATPVKVVSHGWDKFGGRIDADLFRVSPLHGLENFATFMLEGGHAKPWDGKGVKP